MKAFLIVIGILLIFVSGTIIYQDVYNELQYQEHPIKTRVTFQSNLIGEGVHEDYLYPYSNRELLVLAMALGGIFSVIAGFTFAGGSSRRKSSSSASASSESKKKKN